jgi:hypothetical protein
MAVMTLCYDPINFKGYPHRMKFSLNLSAEPVAEITALAQAAEQADSQ